MVQKPPSKLDSFADFAARTEPLLCKPKDVLRMSLQSMVLFAKWKGRSLDEARAQAAQFNMGILDDGTIYDLPDLPIVEP